MKYLLLLSLVITVAGCTSSVSSEQPPTKMNGREIIYQYGPTEIYKFYDGDVLCYVFSENTRGGISCLRDATSSANRQNKTQ